MAAPNLFHDRRSFLFFPMVAFTALSFVSFFYTHLSRYSLAISCTTCGVCTLAALVVESLILYRRDVIHDWSLDHQPPYMTSSLASIVVIVFTVLSREAAASETHDTIIWGLVCLYSMAGVVFCGGRMLRILSDFGFYICFCGTAVTLAVVHYHFTWPTWVCVVISSALALIRGTWLHFDPPIMVPILVGGQ